jgi:hypothetical protein
MFEKHKEKLADRAREAALAEESRKAAHEQDERQAKMAMWAHHLEDLQTLLATASGNSAVSEVAVMLKHGEIAVAQATNISLIEDRRGAGQWQGASQGVSFPIGKIAGRSIRYRVGSSRGHFIQGAPVATAVDVGTVTITNQRIVYQGSKRTSESSFAKLLGIQHAPGSITISVSNRQKPTVLYFGSEHDDWLSNHLSIALALYNGEAETVKAQLQSQIDELQAQKPE